MTHPLRPVDFAAAFGCMVVSSWLGLTGRLFGGLPSDDAVRFFGEVWGDSLAADTMFASGSLGLFLATFWLLRQAPAHGRVLAAWGLGLAGGLLHWVVYTFSFLLLSMDLRGTGSRGSADFVFQVGVVGLLWCLVAPAIALAWIRKDQDSTVASPLTS